MQFLQIELGDPSAVRIVDDSPLLADLANAVWYPGPNNYLFYDWLDGDDGAISALSIHAFQSNPCFSLLARFLTKRKGPFPIFELREANNLVERVLEAFGDIFIIERRTGSAAIYVGLDNWLIDVDRAHLTSYLMPPC